MVDPFRVEEQSIRVIHESMRWGKVNLGPERADIVIRGPGHSGQGGEHEKSHDVVVLRNCWPDHSEAKLTQSTRDTLALYI